MSKSVFETRLRDQLTTAAADHRDLGRVRARIAPLGVAAIGLILVAAIVLPLIRLGGLDRADHRSGIGAGSVQLPDLKPASVVDSAKVPRGATDIWVDASGVWVVGTANITRVDPATGEIVDTFSFRGEDHARIAVAEGSVWATAGFGGIQRIDPNTGTESGQFALSGFVRDIAAGGGYVWAIELAGSSSRLVQIDPKTDQMVVLNDALSAGASRLTYATEGIWVTDEAAGASRLIDPSNGASVQTIAGADPASVGTEEWALDGDQLRNVDASGAVSMSVRVGRAAALVRDAQGALWVLSLPGSLSDSTYDPDPTRPGTITQVDPRNGDIVGQPVPFGMTPASIAPSGRGVWVVEYDSGRLVHIA